jgi:hypothetical protein
MSVSVPHLFNRIVGDGKQKRGHIDAERADGFAILGITSAVA